MSAAHDAHILYWTARGAGLAEGESITLEIPSWPCGLYDGQSCIYSLYSALSDGSDPCRRDLFETMLATEKSLSTSGFELIVGDFDLAAWVTANRRFLLDKFREHGALLFRGFTGGLDAFVSFTDLFCDAYMYNTIPSSRVRLDISRRHKIQTVDLGGAFFPLHAERAQSPFQADIAFFHCRQAPNSGGETTFCDGSLLLSELPENIREYLSSKTFRYLTTSTAEELMNFLDVTDPEQLPGMLEERALDHVFFMNDGRFVMNYIVPALRPSRFSKGLAFASFLLFARYCLKRDDFPTIAVGAKVPQSTCDEIHEIARRLTTSVEWRNDDFLMLDNTRVMHGRNPVLPDSNREIWSRFGYVRPEWIQA